MWMAAVYALDLDRRDPWPESHATEDPVLTCPSHAFFHGAQNLACQGDMARTSILPSEY